jgi:phenylacetate-CoA ligase
MIELSRSGALDDLLVRVEARDLLDADSEGRVSGALALRLKGMCGLSADIEIAGPGGIERSMGKARRVIDKRPRD